MRRRLIELGRIPLLPPLSVDDVLAIARPKGLRALVVSCGDGELGAALKTAGASEVVGLDSFTGSVTRTRLTAAFAVDPDALADLPYPVGYFELLVLEDFSRLLRPERTLPHLARWLAGNGRVICIVNNPFHESLAASLLGGRKIEASSGSRHASVTGALGAIKAAGFELEDEVIAVRTEPGAAAPAICELAVALGRDPRSAQDQVTLARAIVGARKKDPTPSAPPIADPWRGSRAMKVLFTPDLEGPSLRWATSLREVVRGLGTQKNVTIGVTLPASRLSPPPPELEAAATGLDVDLVLIEEPVDAAGWERLLAGAGNWLVTSDRPLPLALARHVGLPHVTNAAQGPRSGAASVPPGLEGSPVAPSSTARNGPSVSSHPRFSVMVPSYNQAHFLKATLESLLAQTYKDWEALVVNDGSTDSTAEVLDAYARRDTRIRPFHQANGGVGAALNRALKESRGEWICWCSSDDLFMPNKLEVHVSAMSEDPATRFWHTNYLMLKDGTGELVQAAFDPKVVIPPTVEQVVRFLHNNYVNGISIAIGREVLLDLGGFNSSLSHGQDYDAWLRASARVRSRFIHLPTCVTRIHPNQGTALFFEAGILDSAWAGATFIEERGFRALFPALDLDRADHASSAVAAALNVAISPGAYLTYAGLSSILLDQAKAFLSSSASPVRRHVKAGLLGALPTATDLSSRRCIEAVAGVGASFKYEPHDPVLLIERRALALESAGAEREAKGFRRYLKMVAERRERSGARKAS